MSAVPTLRVPQPEDFSTEVRSRRLTVSVGAWLGVFFLIAFVTGVFSHQAQLVDGWLPWGTRPVWAYRVSQALHVGAGTAAVPLLLVKLWSVFPRFFTRPPADLRAAALHGLERISIGVLVAGAIFLLATGLANQAQWYPWGFRFRATHEAVGWITIGAMFVHLAVKAPTIAEVWRSRGTESADTEAGRDRASTGRQLTRRGVFRTTLLGSGLAVLATAGAAVPGLRRVSVLAVRSGEGPGGIPINKTARAAGVTVSALASDFQLQIIGRDRSISLSRADLLAMPQVAAELPIACVEGWSASGRWRGVRVQDLVRLVGGAGDEDVRVTSLQERGPFAETVLPGSFVADGNSLLALELNGEPLALDHGFPCRLIAPNRPGVLQTKWVRTVEVLA